MRSRLLTFAATIALILCSYAPLSAQDVENEAQLRFGMEMDWKLAKGLKASFAPELRFGDGDDMSMERFQVEAGLRYKTFGVLYWSANYRLMVFPSGDISVENEKRGQYLLSITAREKFGNFTPSLRIQYTNFVSDEVSEKEFIRYRAGVKYDIPKCPITPYFSAEAFRSVDLALFQKLRYSAGFDLKVMKDRYLDFGYKFDYYLLAYKNRHIFNIGYKLSF